MKLVIMTTMLALASLGSVSAAEFTVTPKVDIESGYATSVERMGLSIQKNSPFVGASVALENGWVTPKVGASYYFKAGGSQLTILDAELSKKVSFSKSVALTLSAGGEKRIAGGIANDAFTAFGEVRLSDFPVLTKIFSPYVVFQNDFDSRIFGYTVGVDRTFNIKSIAITPRVEAYVYDTHTSYSAGGSISYTGIKYVRPYVSAYYITSDAALAAHRFENNTSVTAGVKLSF